MAASASQIEVSGAAFVPMCVKAHGSTPRNAKRVAHQFAMAKTVPRNWAGRRAQKPASSPPCRAAQISDSSVVLAPDGGLGMGAAAPSYPPAQRRGRVPVAHLGTDIPRADFIRWVVLVSACERSLGVVSPHPIKVSRASLTSFRRSADHPGPVRVRLGVHGRKQQPHPSIPSPPSHANNAMPAVAPSVVGRVNHVDLDGEGVSLRARMPPVIQPRLRSVSIRRASFERLNPGRHSVWLRPGIPVASRKFFLIFF